jgi:hypothetical protein
MARNEIEIIARGRDLVSGTFSRMAKGTAASIGKISKTVFNLKTAFVGLAGAGGVGFLVKSFVDASSKMEDFRTRLISMTKSEEEAEEKLRSLSDFASKSPFELPRIIEAGITLEAFGATAEDTIKPLGDLAAFMGLDIVEASSAFGRAFAAGAGAADILRERGVLTLIKLQTGIEDLTKLTLPEFREAMLQAMTDPDGKIFGATERLAQTFSGQVSMMGDAIFNFSNTIGEALLPVMKDLVTNHIVPTIKRLKEWATVNRELIGQKFKEFVDGILKAFNFLVKGMEAVIDKSYILTGVFKLIAASASAVVALIERMALAFTRLQIIGKVFQAIGKSGSALEKIAEDIFKLQRRAEKLNDATFELGENTLKKFDEALESLSGKSKNSENALKKLIEAFRQVNSEAKKAAATQEELFVGPLPEAFVGPPAPEPTKLDKKQLSQMDKLIQKAKELGKTRLQLFIEESNKLAEIVNKSDESEQKKREFFQATNDLKLELFQQENEQIAEKEQQAAEERARIRMEELQRVADHGDSLAEVMSAKIQLFAANAQSVTSIMADTIIQIGGLIKNAIDDSLFALITGAGDMEQIWTSLWQSMLRAVISAVTTIIAQYLIMTAAALLGAKTQSIAEMASNAAEVYGNSFASAAAIPEIGWIIAPGAAQANLATFLALAPLAAAAGAGAGSGMVALAHGGIVDSPTLSLIGEAGPEAVIPLSGPEAERRLGGRGVSINNLTLELFPNISDGSFLFNVPRTKLEQWTRRELLPVFDSLNERNIRPQRG